MKVERQIRNHVYSFMKETFDSPRDGKSYTYYSMRKKTTVMKEGKKSSFPKFQGPITVAPKDLEQFKLFLMDILDEGKEW